MREIDLNQTVSKSNFIEIPKEALRNIDGGCTVVKVYQSNVLKTSTRTYCSKYASGCCGGVTTVKIYN